MGAGRLRRLIQAMTSHRGLPLLYSFRRCPYAIRARLAIHYAQCRVVLREVLLRSKPPELVRASAKGTVPVLLLPDRRVIDESLDIMRWALDQHDPDHWLRQDPAQTEALIATNDGPFKQALDRYKYADRFPQRAPADYRADCEVFLCALEHRLARRAFLVSDTLSLADAAILPFIRQFAGVDPHWFAQAPYPQLRRWLNEFLGAPLFTQVMDKYPVWQAGHQPIFFPPDSAQGQT